MGKSHEKRTVYIYTLVDPRTEEIRYVGKTTNLKARAASHWHDVKRKKSHLYNWIRSLKKRGVRPVVRVIEETDTDHWQDRERYWIDEGYRLGWRLTNATDGGDGGSGRRGWNHTIQTRKKISKANSGKRHHQYGKRVPDEVKAKISESHIGKKNHFYGKTHSEESRNLMSQRLRGRAPINRRAVLIDGVIYESVRAASVAYGVSEGAIIGRIRSITESFQGYSYLDEADQPKPLLTKSEQFSGENNPAAKIGWSEVRRIRALREEGGLTLARISDIMGICQSQVGNICSYRSWKEKD